MEIGIRKKSQSGEKLREKQSWQREQYTQKLERKNKLGMFHEEKDGQGVWSIGMEGKT